jgi:ABC-type molybdate transport system ATPase subunit
MLEVDIEHRLGTFALDVHFRSGRGLTALFGRSGGGKTSVVDTIAGLISPHKGRIVVDGSVMFFQKGRLSPHLTVRQNLLFGRWFAPTAARPPRRRDRPARDWRAARPPAEPVVGWGKINGSRSAAPPSGISALNVPASRVEALVPIEEAALEVQLRLGVERLLARVTRRSGAALGLAPGSKSSR